MVPPEALFKPSGQEGPPTASSCPYDWGGANLFLANHLLYFASRLTAPPSEWVPEQPAPGPTRMLIGSAPPPVADLAGVMQRPGRFPQNWHAARAHQIASGYGHRERALERARAPAVSRDGPLNGLNGVIPAVQPVHLAESLPPKAVASAGHDQKECFGRHEFLPLGPRLKARTAEKLFWAPSAFHSGASCCCPREQLEKLSHGVGKGFCQGCS